MEVEPLVEPFQIECWEEASLKLWRVGQKRDLRYLGVKRARENHDTKQRRWKPEE